MSTATAIRMSAPGIGPTWLPRCASHAVLPDSGWPSSFRLAPSSTNSVHSVASTGW